MPPLCGSTRWGGADGLFRLEDNLRKFNGDRSVLEPLITLLTRLVAAGVSPAAFVRCGILARLGSDMDWRNWERNHFAAMTALADLVLDLRVSSPFSGPLGGGKNLPPDIVSVKYAVGPLARLPVAELLDPPLVEAYAKAWKAIRLDHPVTLYFLRRNVLPFLYVESGRLDLQAIVGLLQQIPAIESAVAQFFPEDLYQPEFLAYADQIQFYDPDPMEALELRRERGMTDLTLLKELNLFLKILQRLLSLESGFFVAATVVRILQRNVGTRLIEDLDRLFTLLSPFAGLREWEWHAWRLVARAPAEREGWLRSVEENGGRDPVYRNPEQIFTAASTPVRDDPLSDLAEALGLEYDKQTLSRGSFLAEFARVHPVLADQLEALRRGAYEGLDVSWGPEAWQDLGRLGPQFHRFMLRYLIPGVSLSLYARTKSSSFKDLWTNYRGSLIGPSLQMEHRFSLSFAAPAGRDKYALARKSLNLSFLQEHWDRVRGRTVTVAPLELFRRQQLSWSEALDRTVTQRTDVNTTADLSRKLQAQETALKTKINLLETVSEQLRGQTDQIQHLVSLVVGSQILKEPSQLQGLLLASVRNNPAIQERLAYLEEDLRIEIITAQQIEYLCNVWQTVAALYREDPATKVALSSILADEELTSALAPYCLTKKKQVSLESLDAAIRCISELSRLNGEQARWNGVLTRADATAVSTRSFLIRTSKAPLDAYFGEMGGTCLSSHSNFIALPGFHVLRLWDEARSQVIGCALLALNVRHCQSLAAPGPHWLLFGVNCLSSEGRSWGTRQLMELWNGFRALAMRVARETNFALLVPGIGSWGLVSNEPRLSDLIIAAERHLGGIEVTDAFGFSLYYSEEAYARALVIHQPGQGHH